MSNKINTAWTKLLFRIAKTLASRRVADEGDGFPIDPSLMPIDLAERGMRDLERVV